MELDSKQREALQALYEKAVDLQSDLWRILCLKEKPLPQADSSLEGRLKKLEERSNEMELWANGWMAGDQVVRERLAKLEESLDLDP